MDNNIETEEIWRDVEGYEGLYQVSNCGKVKSLDKLVKCYYGSTRLIKGRVLRTRKNKDDYFYLDLSKDGKKRSFYVHRLVWEAFNGKRPEGMEVNHIDEDKSNNSIENLNLMTPKQNVNWGTGIERRKKKLINRKDQSKPVLQLDLKGNFLAEYPSQSEAERKLGINQGNINNVLKGRCKTAGGYIWKYKNPTPQNKAI